MAHSGKSSAKKVVEEEVADAAAGEVAWVGEGATEVGTAVVGEPELRC